MKEITNIHIEQLKEALMLITGITDMQTEELKEVLNSLKTIPKTTEYSASFTVFPQDCNYNDPPSIFGGKMLAEMDNAAAMACRRALYNTDCTDAITVAVESVKFTRPAYIGEIVRINANVIEVGEKSLKVNIICNRENKKGEIDRMATGVFVFCARKNGIPAQHGLRINEIPAQHGLRIVET